MAVLVRSFFIALLLGSCVSPGLQPGEGFVDVEGGRVWYRVVGSGTDTPLLLLHGGPGVSSHYMNPLAGVAEDRPVVFYDQLGAGRSDQPDDPTLWTVDRFVRELDQVRTALGLDEIHILGHSWGTMLAVEYMLTEPDGVHSLVLASPSISVERWSADAELLKQALSEQQQAAIERHEAAGTFDSDEYQQAMMAYYRLYLSRSDPWPQDIERTFESLNPAIYGFMWGPSEFTATGTLKDFERAEALRELNLPILVTIGRHDEITVDTARYYQGLAPDAQLVIIEDAAHLTMQDQPEQYVEVVRDFLRKVDRQATP